jgi:hypothetical protein
MNGIDEIIYDIQTHLARIDKGVVLAKEAGDFFANSVRKAKEVFQKDTDEWHLLNRWENETGYVWHPVYKSGVYADDKLKNKIIELLNKLIEIKKISNKAEKNGQSEVSGTPRIIHLKMLYGDEFIDYIKDEVGVDNFLKDVFARKEQQKNDFLLNDKKVETFLKRWAGFVHKYKNLYGQAVRDTDAIKKLKDSGILADASLYAFRNKLFKADFELDKNFISELEHYTNKLIEADSSLDLSISKKDQNLIDSKMW